jgi:hypothetical protein
METLGAPSTIALLARFAIDPIVAVWPRTLAAAGEIARRFADAGLQPALWPMLADEDGRWISAENADRFCAFAEELARAAGAREIVLDLEPPIESVRETIASRAVSAHILPIRSDGAAFRRARQTIAALVRRLHEAGATVSAAIALPVLCDSPSGSPAWQERLGTPVDGVAWDHVTPMLYSSIVEGWSRGLLSRADARAILAWSAEATRTRFGAIAGASLGAVGTGAFGDEPIYRSPAELADDTAIAQAAGLDDLALFDLGGALARPPVEEWLTAFVATPPLARLPAPTARARAAVAGMRLAGRAFGMIVRAVSGTVR